MTNTARDLIIRSWRDADFEEALTQDQREQLPSNPAGRLKVVTTDSLTPPSTSIAPGGTCDTSIAPSGCCSTSIAPGGTCDTSIAPDGCC